MKKLFLLLAIATLAATGCRSHDDMDSNGMHRYNNGMNNGMNNGYNGANGTMNDGTKGAGNGTMNP